MIEIMSQGDSMSKIFISLTVACFSITAFSSKKIVYGTDDRLDFYQADSTMKSLSKSVGGIFAKDVSLEIDCDRTMLDPKTLKSNRNLCDGQKFANQKSLVHCTFFLVAKDVVVTAGHCMNMANSCDNSKFLFDFKITKAGGKADVLMDNKNIYSCKKIISQRLEKIDKRPNFDYALVQLDREVLDRDPLKFRYQGKSISDIENFESLDVDTPLAVIGHPSGLPLKIAGNSKVTSIPSKDYFLSNLDTFGGNSGSPVFNTDTNEVVGILVRGQKDYIDDSVKNCSMVNTLESINSLDKAITLKGEAVSNIYQIKELYK